MWSFTSPDYSKKFSLNPSSQAIYQAYIIGFFFSYFLKNSVYFYFSCSETNQRKTPPISGVYGVGQGQICWQVMDGCHTKSNSMLSNTLISLDTGELVAVTFGNLDLNHHQNTAPIHME